MSHYVVLDQTMTPLKCSCGLLVKHLPSNWSAVAGHLLQYNNAVGQGTTPAGQLGHFILMAAAWQIQCHAETGNEPDARAMGREGGGVDRGGVLSHQAGFISLAWTQGTSSCETLQGDLAQMPTSEILKAASLHSPIQHLLGPQLLH